MIKSDRTPAEVADLDAERAERPQSHTIFRGPPDVFAVADPAGGEVIFFDTVLAYAFGHGVGSVTLTTQQQRVNATGTPFEERRITAILKASLPALQHLKAVIVEIERRAADEAVAATASKPEGQLAH